VASGSAPLSKDVGDGLVRLGQAAAVLVAEPTKCFASFPVNFGQPELDSRLAARGVQFEQELDSGQIDKRHVAHEEHEQTERRPSFCDQCRHALANVIDVEVEECPFGSDHEHVIDGFVLRMPREIGEVGRAGYASELGDPGARRAAA
jgi:hypothetical protein